MLHDARAASKVPGRDLTSGPRSASFSLRLPVPFGLGVVSAAVALISGGVDSAVLVAQLIKEGSMVHPLYVATGMSWEPVERQYLARYLTAIACDALLPLHVLNLPVSDIYGSHWSLSGEGAPGYEAPDQDVYLPGRNLLLVGKAAIYCSLNKIERIAMGLLGGNPFPDATDEFFYVLRRSLSLGLNARIFIERPFKTMHKEAVIALGRALPLELTFSCIRPSDGLHCGDCNKCAERQRGFRDAGMIDRTTYAQARELV
ncbi:MAG: 7-cyano-7-deazaguanine synthase [Chloroflexi bacterium]|nr:7-cyano-7-deazaguanine synthase [Chloroflexota bacterium]